MKMYSSEWIITLKFWRKKVARRWVRNLFMVDLLVYLISPAVHRLICILFSDDIAKTINLIILRLEVCNWNVPCNCRQNYFIFGPCIKLLGLFLKKNSPLWSLCPYVFIYEAMDNLRTSNRNSEPVMELENEWKMEYRAIFSKQFFSSSFLEPFIALCLSFFSNFCFCSSSFFTRFFLYSIKNPNTCHLKFLLSSQIPKERGLQYDLYFLSQLR